MRVVEDLQRSRLTVFFRLLLAVPHLIWLALWTIVVLVVGLVAGVIVFVRARLPKSLHRFFTAYIRYATHVQAYISLAANPFPGFTGAAGYEVDLDFDPPERQNRWKTFFRFILVLPAVLLTAVLGWGITYTFSSYSTRTESTNSVGFRINGVLAACAFLTWFYALAKGRAHEALARLQWYCLHYGSQVAAYGLLVTDRYPTSDPERVGVPWPAPPHPVRLTHAPDDGKRSRLTVFFRFALTIPHLVWLTLWGIAVLIVGIVNWLATLISGRSPNAFHNFLSAYVRYQTHVGAYLTLAANPFPGFVGDQESYPVDAWIADRGRQDRIKVAFRLILAVPAFIINSALQTAALVAAVLGWFAALFTGRMPDGLRKLLLFALRYNAQTSAYGWALLTENYPYPGPPADAMPEGGDEPGFWPAIDSSADRTPAHSEGFAADDPRSGWVSSPFGKETND